MSQAARLHCATTVRPAGRRPAAVVARRSGRVASPPAAQTTGNRSFAQAVRPTVQRAPAPTTTSWDVPPDYLPFATEPVPANDRLAAKQAIDFIAIGLNERSSGLDDRGTKDMAALAARTRAEGAKVGTGGLDAGQVAKLQEWYRLMDIDATAIVRESMERVAAALEPSADEVREFEQAQENLQDQRDDLTHGLLGESSVDQLKPILDLLAKQKAVNEKLKDYSEKTKKYAGYLKTVPLAKKVKEFADKVGTANKEWGENLKSAEDTYKLTSELATMVKLNNVPGGSRMQGDIKAFSAAINIADKTVGKFASGIPLLGKVWSEIYKPMVTWCIAQLKKIAQADERTGRNLQVQEWLANPSTPRTAAGAPMLSKATQFNNFFPGGQPVLDYMFSVRAESPIPISTEVKVFFLEKVDLWNKVVGGQDKLKSDWKVLSPSTLTTANRITNLDVWVPKHFRQIWGTLYGSIGRSIPY